MSPEQYDAYAKSLFADASALLADTANVELVPVYSNSIYPHVELTAPRRIRYPYGFSMLVYRLVRLALASGPFFSEKPGFSPLDREAAKTILAIIVEHIVTAGEQGGPDYPVDPRVIQMAERLTKDANIFFILHEMSHVRVEDDKAGVLIELMTWGTAAVLPDASRRFEHEVLADRLASIAFFSSQLQKTQDHYVELKSMHPILDRFTASELQRRDQGMRLVGIECGLFVQLVMTRFTDVDASGYPPFDERIAWNRKFLIDAYGLSEDVFGAPELVLRHMLELLEEVARERQ
jgi:hypothetical protein